MNSQMQHNFRQLYRMVERGIKGAVDYIAEEDIPVTEDALRKALLKKDGEVRCAVSMLIDSMLEDIADPNRSDSFSDLDEKRIKAAKDIISGKPSLFYKSDWEEIVGTQVSETYEIEEAAIERDRQETISLLQTKQVRDQIEDMLRDQADLEEMRKDPYKYYGCSKENLYGVKNA